MRRVKATLTTYLRIIVGHGVGFDQVSQAADFVSSGVRKREMHETQEGAMCDEIPGQIGEVWLENKI